MSSFIKTYQGVVYPWHCDLMGHMNVMWYTSKFDEATWGFFALLGITPTYIREKKRGMVAVEQHTYYKKELIAGDIIEVRTQLFEMREKVIIFAHELINAEKNEIAAITKLTGVHLDLSSRKAYPFTKEILLKAEELSASYMSKN